VLRASPRLPALTGMRIFAALAVYASHLGPPHGAPPALKAFLESGYMGVTLFFTLSGFVLTINYFERLRNPSARATWQFGVARFARIYPIYILILFYILVREHAFGANLTGWWEHVLAIQAWDPNVFQAYNFNGPAWSVSVEVFLYACFPLLVVALARLRTPRALLAAAVGVALIMTALTTWFAVTGRGTLPAADPESAHRWLYVTPLTRLGDFTLGILAARLYTFTRDRVGVVRAGGPLAITAALITIVLMAWPANLFSVWSLDLAYALPTAVLIFGLAVAPAESFCPHPVLARDRSTRRVLLRVLPCPPARPGVLWRRPLGRRDIGDDRRLREPHARRHPLPCGRPARNGRAPSAALPPSDSGLQIPPDRWPATIAASTNRAGRRASRGAAGDQVGKADGQVLC
jgi:peptidoglycan/LPS O-acetylase OafA/YrhL